MKANNLQLGIGTGSGTLLSAFALIGAHDVMKAAVLAAIGAVVSFAVSWLLQRLAMKKGWPRKCIRLIAGGVQPPIY